MGIATAEFGSDASRGESEVSAVPSRVGGSIADCGGELTGPVATNNL
jgi:hypothetical protein